MGFRGGVNITGADIPDGSITTAKLADSAVTGPKLTDGVVDTAKLADGSVASAKIAISLRSDNYSPGAAGWAINRDSGDVEFADGTFRGLVEAATVRGSLMQTAESGRRIEIGPQVLSGVIPIMAMRGSIEPYFPGNVHALSDVSTVNVNYGTYSSVLCRFNSPFLTSTDDIAGVQVESAPSGNRPRIRMTRDLHCDTSLVLLDVPLYTKVYGDGNQRIHRNAAEDRLWLDGWWGVRVRANGVDVSENIGGGNLAESRTETKAGTGFRRHTAFDHFNTSDERLKRNVRPAPANVKHLEIVNAAPVHHWEDVDGEERCGPMSRDLPALVKAKTRLQPTRQVTRERQRRLANDPETGEKRWAPEEVEETELLDPVEDIEIVSTASLIGVLWGAIGELTSRLAVLEGRAPR